MARVFARHKFTHVVNDPAALEACFTDNGFEIESIAHINRAALGYRAASPDRPGSMTNARIVARAI
jgi:hypothetical protein